MTTPAPGDPAPDFTLPDSHGTPVSLAGLRGTPFVLVFYPYAFSGVCGTEMCELRDNLDDFTGSGVTVFGVSCDPLFALRAWREQEGFGFELLSDFWPHGAAAQSYGVFRPETGIAGRGSFLVDGEGLVRWSVMSPGGKARDLGAYRAAVAAL